jgi:hypothetical protein
MFIIGILVIAVSVVGVLVNLSVPLSFLTNLPAMPVIYLGVDAFFGLVLIIISLNRNIMY